VRRNKGQQGALCRRRTLRGKQVGQSLYHSYSKEIDGTQARGQKRVKATEGVRAIRRQHLAWTWLPAPGFLVPRNEASKVHINLPQTGRTPEHAERSCRLRRKGFMGKKADRIRPSRNRFSNLSNRNFRSGERNSREKRKTFKHRETGSLNAAQRKTCQTKSGIAGITLSEGLI